MAGKSFSPEYYQFREIKIRLLKKEGLYGHSQKFTAHHLLPTSLYPEGLYDEDNVFLLPEPLHPVIHEKYSNQELLLDPITPIIEVIENFRE